MTTKYPGDWVVDMLLEGKMSSHRQSVKLISDQIGSTVEPDSDQYVNRFTVPSTSSSKTYLVSQRRKSGEWCCSCRGWTTKRRCKHLTDVLQRLAERSTTIDVDISSSASEMLASARSAFDMLGGIK